MLGAWSQPPAKTHPGASAMHSDPPPHPLE
jgi:hypothetical protein